MTVMVIGVVFGGSVLCLLRMAASAPELVVPPLSWWPCDVCDRPVPVGAAHTPHEAGCGIDDPERERCVCDAWLCSGCCPCDLEAGAVAS